MTLGQEEWRSHCLEASSAQNPAYRWALHFFEYALTMNDALIIQQPASAAQQLFLLFYGADAAPLLLLPLASRVAAAFPNALVVVCETPEQVSDFEQTVRHWQQMSALSASQTALIGFSQGANMALAASQSVPVLAGRIVSHSGRFAKLPLHIHTEVTLHIIHGKVDAVMPYGECIEAAEHLKALGVDFTADIIPFVGHEMTDETMDLIIKNLQTHLPKRLWDVAMQAAATSA